MSDNMQTVSGVMEANLTPEDIKKLQEAHAQQAMQMEVMRKQLEKIQQDAQSRAVPGSMPSMLCLIHQRGFCSFSQRC